MESKKIIIAFVWIFALAAIVIISLEGGGLTFGGYVAFFVIALISTVTVESLIPGEKQLGSELCSEVESLKTRLDELQAESSQAS